MLHNVTTPTLLSDETQLNRTVTTEQPLPLTKPFERILTDLSVARIYNWGVQNYGAILSLQEQLRQARQDGRIPDTWLVGEHTTVITQGVRGESGDLLKEDEYPVFQVDRGGMTTLHNPGQLVIYPILGIQNGVLAQARVSRLLLATVQELILEISGVDLQTHQGRPGLFYNEHKVAAIGISIHGGVTMHGIAINLCNDLTPWRAIVPCGEPETEPINLSAVTGHLIEPIDVLKRLPDWLQHVWGYDQVEQAQNV